MSRAISVIAQEAFENMRAVKRQPVSTGFPAAYPYLDAMLDLNSLSDRYGHDSGKSVVLYFLANAGQWRGDVARRIKAELKELVK